MTIFLEIWLFFSTLLIIATFFGAVAKFHWFFNLWTHFRVQYFLLSGVLIFSSTYLSKIPHEEIFGFLLLICFCWNGILILPYFKFKKIETKNLLSLQKFKNLKIFFSNFYKNNYHTSLLLKQIEKENPDFVGIVEFNEQQKLGFEPLNENYPYSADICRNDGFGLAFYSKFPFEKIYQSLFENQPFFILKILQPQKTFHVTIAHPPPPKAINEAKIFQEQLKELTEQIKGKDMIVIGDFNASPWCYHFQKFLKNTNLQNPRKIFGLKFSWMRLTPFFLPIDHILASTNFAFTNFQILKHV